MQVINSSAEIIEFSLNSTDRVEDIGAIAKIIKKQVARAKKLVQNVNILSDLEQGEKSIKTIDSFELLNNSITYIKTAHQEKFVDISTESFSDRIFVKANELVQDVFDNILTNAIKYNDSSFIMISVKSSKEQVDDKKFIRFEITDNGIGIRDERKHFIFKRGYAEFKGQKGMGLGLSLVYKIIESYGGKIWVENKIEGDYTQGSKFVLLIPQAT